MDNSDKQRLVQFQSDTENKVIKSVEKNIAEHCLVSKNDKILVALSGGADSVCLLSVLLKLCQKLSVSVAAAHLNHMIRGIEADSDEAYCAELCTRLNIPFYAKRADIPQIAKEQGISEELAGRNERYAFLDELCKQHGYTKFATAHNKNDRAETVLMRILRGTGTEGLASIKYSRDNIIRPILDIERADIEKYCKAAGLRYCTDSTNSTLDYTRNRIRNEIIPLLKTSFNPSVINTLCQLADNASEDADFINGYAKRLYDRINSPLPKRRPIMIDIKSLKMIDKGIRNRIILLGAKDAMYSEYTLQRNHVEYINNILDSETGTSVDLPEGLKACIKYGWLEFITKEDEAAMQNCRSYRYELDLDDTKNVSIDDITAASVEFYDNSDINTDIDTNIRITVAVTEPTVKPKNNQMLLDYDMLRDKLLCIRNRRIGDKIVLYKNGGSKKLKSYFIDKKLPKNERDKIPLLCATDTETNKTEIAAIIGDRIAENYKIKKNTKKGLLITYDRSK